MLHAMLLLCYFRRDEIVIKTGSWVGGLLVDGLGDGAIIEAEGEDLDFLRTTSFGLLQVCLVQGFAASLA
jgi:(E)-4-hydroxy-3-methylbut-2-enyl-diphosphate synthase